MNASNTFRAPWSKTLVWVSAIATLLCFSIGIFLHRQMFPFAPLGVLSVTLLLSAALPFFAVPFSITGYTIQSDRLLVHRLGWNTVIDISQLKDARYDETATKGSWRICGNGGLFSFTGWFSSGTLGVYRGFFTDTKRTVVITLLKRKIVVSPEDPTDFVDLLLTNKNS